MKVEVKCFSDNDVRITVEKIEIVNAENGIEDID